MELTWPYIMGGIIIIIMIIYSLTGGADFGGGVWDLLATGPRAQRQRRLISKAIGPIWEANHVWLILVVVIMFANFPLAFSTLFNALFIPLTIMVLGIVARGGAFAFRAYDTGESYRRWSLVFSIASIIAPIMLGVCVGACSTGNIRIDFYGWFVSGYTEAWWQPFPFAVGLLTLACFAFLAAVYLADFTNSEDLRDDFRRRAIWAGIAVGVMAYVTLWIARTDAPMIIKGLTRQPWSWPLHGITGVTALSCFAALTLRRFALARVLATIQVALLIIGWASAQYPFVAYPMVTISLGTAPPAVMRLTFWVLCIGSALLIPSFFYLFRLFAQEEEMAAPDRTKTGSGSDTLELPLAATEGQGADDGKQGLGERTTDVDPVGPHGEG
jgi:cytochrome d ubiquinol oxidase subunit II